MPTPQVRPTYRYVVLTDHEAEWLEAVLAMHRAHYNESWENRRMSDEILARIRREAEPQKPPVQTLDCNPNCCLT